jgi:hypothetical protein
MPRPKKPANQARPITLRYDGPTHVLEIDDDTKIAVGETDNVSVATAQHLLGCDYADVTVIDGDVPALWPESHRKIDALAEGLGVDWPEPQNGEGPLDIAAKIEVLEAACYLPDGTRAEGDPDKKEG